jgi:Skp family chaperone for outer membrane proteins
MGRIAFRFVLWELMFVKKTIIAVITAAALSGAFVCLPPVRGQNGAAVERPSGATKSASPKSSATPKIAVIDVRMILREYKKSADKLQEIKDLADAGNAKIRQMQAEGQALARPLQDETLDPDSDEVRVRQKKVFQLESSIKATKALAERDMNVQGVKITLAVYQDLQAALKLFSDQNGYTLVLQIDREAAQAKDYRVVAKLPVQNIFFYRSYDDITLAVLSHLNNRYQTEQAVADESTAPVSSPIQSNRTLPVSPNRKAPTR